MGRSLIKIQLWIIRMYLASLVLYVVYSIRWLHCKAWLHVCYRSSSSVALYVHQHMIWSQSKLNLCYLHQTSSHNFLCHKHAIIPQKKVSFSFSRPQARSNNIGQIPVERRQCCLLFSLHSRRLQNIIANSYFIWMLYKDTHLTISSSRM